MHALSGILAALIERQKTGQGIYLEVALMETALHFARTVALVQTASAGRTLDQALAHPQVSARGLIVESEHPVLGTVKNVGLPVRFGRAPREAHRSAPLLGEHTNEILREAGYSVEQILHLSQDGIVAIRAPQAEPA